MNRVASSSGSFHPWARLSFSGLPGRRGLWMTERTRRVMGGAGSSDVGAGLIILLRKPSPDDERQPQPSTAICYCARQGFAPTPIRTSGGGGQGEPAGKLRVENP